MKFIFCISVFLLFGMSIWVDLAFGIYTNWKFLTIATILVTLTVAWLFKLRKNKKSALSISVIAILMLSIRYWDYNSLKPFMRKLDTLEQGMTKEDVIQSMSDYKLAGHGKGFISVSEREAEPELENKVEFVNFTHTEEGWGDSDWGYVYFIDNKLYRTGFSHD